jgi:hypothetical protein
MSPMTVLNEITVSDWALCSNSEQNAGEFTVAVSVEITGKRPWGGSSGLSSGLLLLLCACSSMVFTKSLSDSIASFPIRI